MKNLRSAFLWIHLSVGLVVGTVILYLSVTGLLLAFKPQIIDLTRVGLVGADPAPALPYADLIKKISSENTEELKAITLWRDKTAFFEMQFGKEKHLYSYADGAVLPASYKWNEFFELTTNLHRWFSLKNEGDHKLQKLVKGFSVIFFLFLTFSGIYLWWPTAVTKLNLKLKNKAFNWNLHNVFGFWFSPVIIVISLTGLVMAHQWANSLLFTLAGSEVPVPRKVEEKIQVIPSGQQLAGMIAVAQERIPNWEMLSVKFAKGYVNISIDEDAIAGLYGKSQLSFDAESGQESFWEPYADLSTARKIRATMHPVHTGEAGGFLGQVLVASATLVSILLVWTGFAMSYRRFFKNKSKDLISTGISVVLHLAFFVSTGLSVDSAKFSVDAGLSSLEIKMLASPAKAEVIEVSLADNTDSDFIIEKKKKKKLENPEIQKTTVAEGKSAETVQTEKGGALSEAKPEYLKNPSPVYPATAKNKGQQGLVQIIVDVSSDGSVKHVLLKKSSGFLLLDDAAVRAVKNWQFMPASQNGVQIESQVEIPIRFQLAKNGDSDIVVH